MTSPLNGRLCGFRVSRVVCRCPLACVCVFCRLKRTCNEWKKRRKDKSFVFLASRRHLVAWSRSRITERWVGSYLLKYCLPVFGLAEINRGKIIADGSNALGGSRERSSSLMRNPRSSSLSPSSYVSSSSLNLSSACLPPPGSVASPSRLSPAPRGRGNARIVYFFSSHPLRTTHTHSECMCVFGCGAPCWGPPCVRSCRERERKRDGWMDGWMDGE